MDKRIIKFLESGVCEGLYTVTVKEYHECDECVVVIGNGKYFKDTMRRIAIYNGIYYEISSHIFGVVNAFGVD